MAFAALILTHLVCVAQGLFLNDVTSKSTRVERSGTYVDDVVVAADGLDPEHDDDERHEVPEQREQGAAALTREARDPLTEQQHIASIYVTNKFREKEHTRNVSMVRFTMGTLYGRGTHADRKTDVTVGSHLRVTFPSHPTKTSEQKNSGIVVK